MEYLIWYIASVIGSFAVDISLAFKMMKDIANNGYKFDMNAVLEFNSDDSKKYLNIVPVINVFWSLLKMIQYDNSRAFLIDQLSVMGQIEKMTPEEILEYEKNPKISTIFKQYINSYTNNNSSRHISYEDKKTGEKGEIHFREENGNIIIEKAEGAALKLTNLEQRAMVMDMLSDFKKALNIKMDEFDNEESFKEYLIETAKKNQKIDLGNIQELNDDKIENDKQEENSKLERLKKYREDLINDEIFNPKGAIRSEKKEKVKK